jgi:nitrate/nitrite-specific signal transduction histidine kinase
MLAILKISLPALAARVVVAAVTGDVDAAVKDGHWGVMGMHERARRAGGTLDITSAPGQGTMLSLFYSDRA